MLKKEYVIGALIVAVTFFGFVGTSIAGEPVEYDDAQISIQTNFHTMSTDNMELSYKLPAGEISNLDATTDNFDQGVYVEVDNGNKSFLQCAIPAGKISNMDHTTAELDAKSCS